MRHSFGQTLLFAFGICFVCSVLVSAAAVGLADRQKANKLLDEQRNVLEVAGLLADDEKASREEINRRFTESLDPRIIALPSGDPADGIDPMTFDQRKASRDPEASHPAPQNRAKVRRVPNHARIFELKEGEEVTGIIVPIEGMGLWSVLYGYLALDADARTIRGITYYEHAETAGL
ncbi:MAG: Na(+)-translocating NADH-quinone reductase subunit C, partial [Myxococcota bacterium]